MPISWHMILFYNIFLLFVQVQLLLSLHCQWDFHSTCISIAHRESLSAWCIIVLLHPTLKHCSKFLRDLSVYKNKPHTHYLVPRSSSYPSPLGWEFAIMQQFLLPAPDSSYYRGATAHLSSLFFSPPPTSLILLKCFLLLLRIMKHALLTSCWPHLGEQHPFLQLRSLSLSLSGLDCSYFMACPPARPL